MSPSVFEVDVDTTRKDPEVGHDSEESGRVNWPRQVSSGWSVHWSVGTPGMLYKGRSAVPGVTPSP